MTAPSALDRREAIARLLADRGRTLVVTGLGSTTYDVAALGDHDRNFYLWGAMGGAAMIGLGLALAQPDQPVLVITGDGEMLMGMGAFATIAHQAPPNLAIVIIDNELYGETGAQPTHTAGGADLAAIARACGVERSGEVTDMAGVDALAARLHRANAGLQVAVLKVAPTKTGKTLAIRDGAYVKSRLRLTLGLPAD